MSAKHTPGPWSIMKEESDRSYLRIRSARYKVAHVIIGPGADGQDETIANARLIAAAPDLLTWLGWALDMLPSDSDKQTWQYEQACAAIDKATGEAS